VNCPVCEAGEMTDGFVSVRSPGLKFKPSAGGTMFGDLGGRKVTSGFFMTSAPATQCDSCGTVVIPGSDR
jgi:hypothetical protein